MRKLIALLLVLMLALAAVPALGEDYTGVWYLNYYDAAETLESNDAYNISTVDTIITVMDLTLNEDGSVTVSESESVMPATGTWEATDIGVKLVLNDQPIELTAAEGSLVNKDERTLLSREPFPITFDLVMAYGKAAQAGETIELPEGVTEDDLQNALAVLLEEFGM